MGARFVRREAGRWGVARAYAALAPIAFGGALGAALLSCMACSKREAVAAVEGGDGAAPSAWAPEALPAPSTSRSGEELFVATNGDDGGDGSRARPFRTIQRALEDIAPGTTVVLRGSTDRSKPAAFKGPVRVRPPNITIRSHDGEWAAIRCPVNDEDNAAICVEFDVESSGGRLQRVDVSGGFYYGVSFETKWDWGDPSDRSGASNILVEDCHVHHTGRDAIKIKPGCDDITIRRCEIDHSGAGYAPGTPQEDKNAEGIDNVNGDRMVVQDSYVHDTATTGVYFKGGATGCVVERTRIERAGEGGILAGFDTSVEFFDLKENPGYFEAIGGVVRNNVVVDTGFEGVGLYGTRDTLVANNTLVRTARREHAPIYFGVTLQDYDRDAKRPANTRPTLVNNIVAQPAGSPSACVAIRYSGELGGLAGLTGPARMDHNVYFRQGGACRFVDARPRTALESGTLALWRTHVRGETSSLELDPHLDDTQHLGAGSPCRGKALTLGAVGFDIDREVRASPLDIGADEVP